VQATIGKLLVPTADGGRIPLSQLAEIAVVEGASIIARRENQRQVTVRTNIRGRDQGGFVREAQQAVATRINLPDGYAVEWGGQFENLTRARARLTIVLPVTLAIIFGLLFMTFGRRGMLASCWPAFPLRSSAGWWPCGCAIST
jgi:cobalt-zinc-cadmium resistance protein CzcA